MKVPFFDKQVAASFGVWSSFIATIISLILIFVPLPSDQRTKIWCAIGLSAFFVILYLFIWIHSNTKKKASTKINGNQVYVKTGDLFSMNGNLKVIPFNEFFDTTVDDAIISKTSLNGLYIKKFFPNAEKDLSKRIAANPQLKEKGILVDQTVKGKKKTRYPLGTIHKEGDFLLLAFSKFSQRNEAYLDDKSLWDCLINMWHEIGTTYSGKSIDLPLIGSGITRLKNINLSEQDLLELILLSLKVSGLHLNWNVTINIVIHPNNARHINFHKLSNYLK